MEATTTKTEANEKIEARPEVNLMPASGRVSTVLQSMAPRRILTW